MATKARKAGGRYRLLLYWRVIGRLWAAAALLGLLLLAIWVWAQFSALPLLQAEDSLWLLAGAGVSLAFALFAFFGRSAAYVQPMRDHLRLVTPFLRINISYRRVRRAYPADFNKLFPPKESSWAQERLLSPFYGMTVVVVELTGYPLPPAVLRLFLAPQMFSRRSPGFILLTPDWMALSTELDSLMGAWLRSQRP
ncbi:MAG: hypothetical protein L0Z70_04450 [Chloroflexi bacterium]|nr:hypothetical protein [Chloroflexota bacterium]